MKAAAEELGIPVTSKVDDVLDAGADLLERCGDAA